MVRGNLLEEPVDAIVNAANGRLAHGGGVAGIIARAAGPGFQDESNALVRKHGPFPTASAVVTSAGKLPFKGVIHAVGPRYGEGDEENKLFNALLAAFYEAELRAGIACRFRLFPAASSPCRSTSAPAPTSGPLAPRRSVRFGYACATNRSSTPS